MKRGDIVEIVNGSGRSRFVEGQARLIKPSDIGNEGLNEGWEYWQVEFIDEPGEYFDRVVRGEK